MGPLRRVRSDDDAEVPGCTLLLWFMQSERDVPQKTCNMFFFFRCMYFHIIVLSRSRDSCTWMTWSLYYANRIQVPAHEPKRDLNWVVEMCQTLKQKFPVIKPNQLLDKNGGEILQFVLRMWWMPQAFLARHVLVEGWRRTWAMILEGVFLGLKLAGYPKQRYAARCEETCFITDQTVAQVQFALCLNPVNIWYSRRFGSCGQLTCTGPAASAVEWRQFGWHFSESWGAMFLRDTSWFWQWEL